MFAFLNRILDWFKSLFWKEEMELTLVGLQYSGKTTFVNVIAVSLTDADLVTVWTSTHHEGLCIFSTIIVLKTHIRTHTINTIFVRLLPHI